MVKREEEGSFAVSGKTEITILVENMGYMAWLSQGLGDYSNEYKGNTRNVMWFFAVLSCHFCGEMFSTIRKQGTTNNVLYVSTIVNTVIVW